MIIWNEWASSIIIITVIGQDISVVMKFDCLSMTSYSCDAASRVWLMSTYGDTHNNNQTQIWHKLCVMDFSSFDIRQRSLVKVIVVATSKQAMWAGYAGHQCTHISDILSGVNNSVCDTSHSFPCGIQ